MNRYVLLFSFLFFLSFSCKKNETKKQNITPPFPVDSLIKLSTAADSTNTYYLYLPPQYQDNYMFPAIFAFDAHANGKKIAKWLLPYARQYGYVIIASNKFRNRIPNLAQLLDNLLNDALTRLKIDTNRLYSAGFSGGGRVALLLASTDSRFKGAASICAGIDQSTIPNPNLSIIIFTAYGDFNFWNITNLSPQVAKTFNVPLQIIIFDGSHQYPPSKYARFALLWFEANAFRKKLKPIDKEIIKQIQQLVDSNINAQTAAYQKALAYETAINFLQDLKNVSKYQKKLDQIKQSQQYQQDVQKIHYISQIEQKLQYQYIKALTTKNLQWWQNEIRIINKKLESTQDFDYKSFYLRLKSYISIACFSLARDYIQKGLWKDAQKIITIYKTVDPQNPDVYFYQACLYAHSSQPDSALKAIRQSISLGFSDYERFNQYKCFEGIKTELEKVKNEECGMKNEE